MEKLEISKSLVYYNSHKFNAGGELRQYINSGKLFALVVKIERAINSGSVIVLGGDGTMLKAIKDSASLELPFLGVNFGTKGFLLHALKEVENNFDFDIYDYPLLDCEVKVGDKIMNQIAFNEIDFRANTGKIIDLDIEITNVSPLLTSPQGRGIAQQGGLKTNLKGDGFVFSTPAGSTGYNFSLGGPIIPHSQKSFVLTAKAPWLPRCFRPVIIDDKKTLTIKNIGRLSDIKIVCDGTDFFKTKDEEVIVTISKAETGIKLLVPEKTKIAWEDKIFLEQGFQGVK
ncbi:NAD(+)/NADH kinase [Candidatus Gracilibacteria bacterium]|nr:NAD(+)/NADH kinase [Candidatus Gracilibacteria bacterium]